MSIADEARAEAERKAYRIEEFAGRATIVANESGRSVLATMNKTPVFANRDVAQRVLDLLNGSAQYGDIAFARWHLDGRNPTERETFEAGHSIGWGAGYEVGVADGRKPEAAPSDTDAATAESALAEVERRLRQSDGYGPSDQVRMALLHIDAYREGKARRTSQPVQVEVTDDMVAAALLTFWKAIDTDPVIDPEDFAAMRAALVAALGGGE